MRTPLSSPLKPNTDIRRVGILFSGGPAPAANAVIASTAMCFSRAGIEVLGFCHGYWHLERYDEDGPLEQGTAYVVLDHKDLEGVRTETGIMIGTARANPGKIVRAPDDLKDPDATSPLKTVYDALRSLGIDALISIGGDDTLTTAAKFKLFQDKLPKDKKRIRVVHLPKTIDNDYQGIDFTFGYFTAVDMLATQIRNLLSDGRSARAWYVAQVMGRKAGWLSYGASIAGEGSLVVGLEDIPDQWWSTEETIDPRTGEKLLGKDGKPVMREIIDVEAVVDRIVRTVIARIQEDKPYGVIIMAEGLAEFLPLAEIERCVSHDEFINLKPDSFGHFPVSQLKFSGRVGRWIKQKVKHAIKQDIKISGLQFGYEVRCQRPTAFDVALGSQLGVGAYRALAEQGFDGVMISVTGQLELVYKPFAELIDMKILRAYPRPIKPEEAFHQLARYLEVWVDEDD
jgi:6-phosphofructokinase 1